MSVKNRQLTDDEPGVVVVRVQHSLSQLVIRHILSWELESIDLVF